MQTVDNNSRRVSRRILDSLCISEICNRFILNYHEFHTVNQIGYICSLFKQAIQYAIINGNCSRHMLPNAQAFQRCFSCE